MTRGGDPGPAEGDVRHGEDGPPDFLGALRRRAAEARRTLVYPEGGDPRILQAAAGCLDGGLADVVLLGDPEALRAGLARHGVDGDRATVVPTTDPERVERTLAHVRQRRAGKHDGADALSAMAADPLMQGAAMVASGEVDGMVAGCVRTTADVVRAALVCVGLAPGIRTLSSSFYMVFGDDHPVGARVLTFTDAGVVPTPSPEQLAGIAAAAVVARERIVGDTPRVAFLSYSTKGSAGGPAVEAVLAALADFRERMPDVPADGELQADAALDPTVAVRKAPGSAVAGRANVLVFPDLGAANLSYKLVQHLGGAMALGPVLQGLARPVNDLSRGAAADDIVAVSCITALQSA